MRNIRNIHKSYDVTTTPTRLEPNDAARIGWIIQNQANGAGVDLYISAGGAYSQDACLRLQQGENANEDILGPNQDLWAFTNDPAGAVLTLILKYPG